MSDKEFIDRERQLGPDPRGAAGVNSAGAAETAQMRITPAGEPPKAFDVRAVYDSRPVQGFDFNITVAHEGSGTAVITEFVVPKGYVAVLREVHHSFDPPFAFNSRNDVKMTLTKNHADVSYNVDIPVGIESDDIVKCFVIADESEILGARYTITNAPLAGVATYTQFYGNFLIKTNAPKEFEIANHAARIAQPFKLDINQIAQIVKGAKP